MPGILYIIATPIGNLEDITLRALRILKEVDFIAAEDTRHTQPLLHHYGIQKKVMSYHEYSGGRRHEFFIDMLKEGRNVALVSDAGTPTISDPGARLVSMAMDNNIQVIPIPGPSAIMAALSVSGLPTEPFHFWGFLSPKPSKRKKIYEKILSQDGTHVFYESPHKILKHLEEWQGYFGEYFIFVGREMTKKFETYWMGPFGEIAVRLKESTIRGEFTILLSTHRMLVRT